MAGEESLGEESFINKLKEDRGAALMALVALLLIIFGVFAVLGGAAVVTLNPPTNLQATVVDNDIKLTWDHSSDYPDPCVGYNVYLSTAAGQLGVLQNVEPVADNKYTVRDVSPGTYYATVRCTDMNGNEDGNLNQLEIVVEIPPPSGLSIIINNNAIYTNKRDVTLTLSASNADECTYANEDMAWIQWKPYTVEKPWTLTENLGGVCEEKTVYYKCRRLGLESRSVSDTIILDTLPPAVSFNVLSVNDNLATLQIFAQDDCDNTVDCYVFAADQQIASIPNVAGEATQTVEVPYGKSYLTVSCTDDAGNTGSAALEINVEPPKNITNKTTFASIKINNDAPTTTNLNVQLTLSAAINGKEPEEVYYSSNEMGTVGPESYTTSRSWVLDNSAPDSTRTYTVCYEAKTGATEAHACDSIRYVVEEEGGGGGDGGGGGGGDQNQPPKNLRIEIIGKRPAYIGSGFYISTLIDDTSVTRWPDVSLNLSSSGATECKVWEDPPPEVDVNGTPEDAAEWNSTYTNGIVAFSLYPKIAIKTPNGSEVVIVPDGLRTVLYRCRNENGNSSAINDTIWYDATKPSSVTDLNGQYRTTLGNLSLINIHLNWTPSLDNSLNWTDYVNKGVQLYTIERYYILSDGVHSVVYPLGPEDYIPADLNCSEEDMSPECTFIDLDLPGNLTSSGGTMCYKVSAWDFVGLRSDEEEVCVDVPPSTGEGEGPEIEWVAIYSSPFGTPGRGQPGGPAPEGDEYTNTTLVQVYVMAKNAADQCKIKNDLEDWSGWFDYNDNPTSYPWTLREDEGKRTVSAQCKNENGTNSAIKSDSIILDYTPPQPPVLVIAPLYVETTERNWIYVAWGGFSDPISGIKEYRLTEYTKKQLPPDKGQLEPVWTETGNWTMNANETSFYDYEFVKDTTYQYRIVACDNAGNCQNEIVLGTVTPPRDPYYYPGD